MVKTARNKKMTPVKVIRAMCLKCASGPKAVRECTDPDCPAFPYRMGTHPGRKGIGGRPSLRNE